MKYKINPSVFAKADKAKIIDYLAQFSVNAPLKFKRELKKHMEIIALMPNIYATWEFNSAYRHTVIFGSYVMFYTVDEESKTVFVYRILHGSQDIADIL